MIEESTMTELTEFFQSFQKLFGQWLQKKLAQCCVTAMEE